MANEPKKQTGTDRPGQPRQNPSGGSSQQPGQQNPGRRSDEWSDKGGTRPSNPNDPSRRRDDDDDMEESENPA
ncbi:MAG TPA: hypothetical protein VF424_08640 [Vicinamibacterales bacterium]